ncbi:MAG: hypothetical protein LBR80_17415 [Deltaproteobacteria bacterium]|jgi:hypothetical protein|nr:hypothetical protein [Deltaproteobacteria bacterium]
MTPISPASRAAPGILVAAALAALALAAPSAFPARWPGAPPEALAASDCSGSREAADRRIERDKEREAERRRTNFPDDDPESIFRKCLGGILRGPSPAGLPPLPDMDDAIEALCRAARREMGKTLAVPSPAYGLAPDRGANTTLPWTGTLNEDIWNALRQVY